MVELVPRVERENEIDSDFLLRSSFCSALNFVAIPEEKGLGLLRSLHQAYSQFLLVRQRLLEALLLLSQSIYRTDCLPISNAMPCCEIHLFSMWMAQPPRSRVNLHSTVVPTQVVSVYCWLSRLKEGGHGPLNSLPETNKNGECKVQMHGFACRSLISCWIPCSSPDPYVLTTLIWTALCSCLPLSSLATWQWPTVHVLTFELGLNFLTFLHSAAGSGAIHSRYSFAKHNRASCQIRDG